MGFNLFGRKDDAVELNRQALELIEGDAEKALSLFNRAIELAPRLAQLRLNRATCLAKLGRNVDAFASCKEGIELDPSSALGWYTLGFFATQAEAYDAGADALATATEKDPSLAPAWFYRAKCLRALGRGEEAEACERRLEKLKSK
jgi:tetratricopeptide (TPR) repeat protein